jgi:putative restriction endonuclease
VGWVFLFICSVSTQVTINTGTPSTIRETVEYAYLDDELWAILQNPEDRSIVTHTLISEWFSDRSGDIEPLLQINAFAQQHQR